MTVKVPSLDDLGYADIVEDSTKRIPIYSPEWTNHNVYDPGITILDMLAWIAEARIFELDQLAERHYLKFLKLMGVLPLPQQCAVVDLAFTENNGFDFITAGTEFWTTNEAGEKIPFSTDRDLTVTPATITKVISVNNIGMEDNTTANSTDGIFYYSFGAEARKESMTYIGFDRNPFPDSIDTLNITIKTYENNLSPIATHGDEPASVKVSVKVEWQYWNPKKNNQGKGDQGTWDNFEVSRDNNEEIILTLQQSGVIVLKKPSEWNSGKLFDNKERWWIRCTVKEEGYEIPPQLDSISINMVSATQKACFENSLELTREKNDLIFDVNVSTGLPGQVFFFCEKMPGKGDCFHQKQIIDSNIQIDNVDWKEVTDFDNAGPDDMVYVLDRKNGAITFGNGINGKIPPADKKIIATSYTIGGGSRGNVKALSTWYFEDKVKDTVKNPDSAKNGIDGETYIQALERLKTDMKVPYTAVTADDFCYIATHTPGLRFGRAKAFLTKKVLTKKETVESCETERSVKVIVLPYSPFDRPLPSKGFLDTVREHIESHRLITTQVDVEGPVYVEIVVRATVVLEQGYSQEGRRSEIEKELKNFLHPLLGGDNGEGWPLGRTVYKSEIYETINHVEGISCVSSVILYSTDGTTDDDGNVKIKENELVYLSNLILNITGRESQCSGR